eukprot:SAG22_NODE_559_length_9115_cov_4.969720_6_plen_385_part_00
MADDRGGDGGGGGWTEAGGSKRAQRRAQKQILYEKHRQAERAASNQQNGGGKKKQGQARAPPTKIGGKPGQVLKAAGEPLGCRRPAVIVLVGMPGSGKSTFCAALSSELAAQRAEAAGLPAGVYAGPVRVSQDDLGGRKPCVMLAEAALGLGHSLLIDRCNFDEQQRAHWLKLRRGPAVAAPLLVAVNFRTPAAVCKQRVNARVGHPTLGPGAESMRIIDRFERMLKWPKAGGAGGRRGGEGFEVVLELQPTAASNQAVAAETARLLVAEHVAAATAQPEPVPEPEPETATAGAGGMWVGAPAFVPGGGGGGGGGLHWGALVTGLPAVVRTLSEQSDGERARREAAEVEAAEAEAAAAAAEAELEAVQRQLAAARIESANVDGV